MKIPVKWTVHDKKLHLMSCWFLQSKQIQVHLELSRKFGFILIEMCLFLLDNIYIICLWILACVRLLSCPRTKRPLEKVIWDETKNVMRIWINSCWSWRLPGIEAVTVRACLNELILCAPDYWSTCDVIFTYTTKIKNNSMIFVQKKAKKYIFLLVFIAL